MRNHPSRADALLVGAIGVATLLGGCDASAGPDAPAESGTTPVSSEPAATIAESTVMVPETVSVRAPDETLAGENLVDKNEPDDNEPDENEPDENEPDENELDEYDADENADDVDEQDEHDGENEPDENEPDENEAGD